MRNICIFRTEDDILHYPTKPTQSFEGAYRGKTKKIWILVPGIHEEMKVVKEEMQQCEYCDKHKTMCYILEDKYIAYRCSDIKRWIYTSIDLNAAQEG